MPRRLWTTLFPRVLAGLCLLAVFGGVAAAQTPPGCNSNFLNLTITKDKTVIVDPDTVTYTVSVTNGGAGACDVVNATISFTCPAADGTPTGTQTVFTTTGSFPAHGSGAPRSPIRRSRAGSSCPFSR